MSSRNPPETGPWGHDGSGGATMDGQLNPQRGWRNLAQGASPGKWGVVFEIEPRRGDGNASGIDAHESALPPPLPGASLRIGIADPGLASRRPGLHSVVRSADFRLCGPAQSVTHPAGLGSVTESAGKSPPRMWRLQSWAPFGAAESVTEPTGSLRSGFALRPRG